MRLFLQAVVVGCVVLPAIAETFKWRRGMDLCFVCGLLAGIAICTIADLPES